MEAGCSILCSEVLTAIPCPYLRMPTSYCVFNIILITSSHLRMSTNIESGLFLAGFRTVSTHSGIGNTQSMDRSFSENYSLLMYLLHGAESFWRS